jgi:putative ABC transport system permease protein
MFFVTYLRRELRRRARQAIFIALGLAVGIGLVVVVGAASAGVKTAQSKELSSLYGVGTAVTVTGSAVGFNPNPPSQNSSGNTLEPGPNGPEECHNGKCTSVAGKTIDGLLSPDNGISDSKVAEVARLDDVTSAAGGISLNDTTMKFPANGGGTPQSSSYTLDGVNTGKLSLGPLSTASLTSGHSFTAAEADSDVAVVDSNYATSHGLKTGLVLTIDSIKFTVIGIVRQSQASAPPDVYIPLRVAQDLSLQQGSLKNEVTTIYVAAASAADISTVSSGLSRLLPGATVTTEASLASEVTGSVNSAAKLVNDLGRWLSVLVLIAAFAVACLLTMAAVGRRVREFGTLKAIGWRTRRIVTQVLGESAVTGIIGAAVGIGLGFAGAGIIAAIAPKLSETYGASSTPVNAPAGAMAGSVGGPTTQPHTVAVPLHPSVTVGVIALAVVLAIAGGLLAGTVASWRIGKLRPADALAKVA